MVEKFNTVLNKNFTSEAELIEYLNEELKRNYELIGDIQSAYNLLNDDTQNLLSEYFCWTIGDWEVELNIPKEQETFLFDMIKQDDKFFDWDDFSEELSNWIRDDECNVGMDPYNALDLELTELFSQTGVNLKKYISIVNSEELKLEKIENLV